MKSLIVILALCFTASLLNAQDSLKVTLSRSEWYDATGQKVKDTVVMVPANHVADLLKMLRMRLPLSSVPLQKVLEQIREADTKRRNH